MEISSWKARQLRYVDIVKRNSNTTAVSPLFIIFYSIGTLLRTYQLRMRQVLLAKALQSHLIRSKRCLRSVKYPRLYSLARKYLGIPATTVPCERLFSMAGHILNKRRASITVKNAYTSIVAVFLWLDGQSQWGRITLWQNSFKFLFY